MRQSELISETELQKNELAARLEKEGGQSFADALNSCCQPKRMRCTCCGEVAIVSTRCRKRFCPVCQRQLAARRAAQYQSIVEGFAWPLFLTLTVPNINKLETGSLRGLMRSFRRLRGQRWWRRSVYGGIASLEVTNKGRGWHPHIHAVIDCKWLGVDVKPPLPEMSQITQKGLFSAAQAAVCEKWAKASKNKTALVWVKRAYSGGSRKGVKRGSEGIEREVLKYSVKASDLIEMEGRATDICNAMLTTRLIVSFGSARGSLKKDPAREPMACKACGESGYFVPDEIIDSMVRRAAHTARYGK